MKHLILILSFFIASIAISQQSKQKFYDHLPLTKLNNYKTFNILTSLKVNVEKEIKDLGYNFLYKNDSGISFVNFDSSSVIIVSYVDCSEDHKNYTKSRDILWKMLEDEFPYFEIYRAKRNFRHYYVFEEYDTEIAILQIPFGHPVYDGKKAKKEKI